MKRNVVSCARNLFEDAAKRVEGVYLAWKYQYRRPLRERSPGSLEDGRQVSLLSADKPGERASTQKRVG